MFKLEGSKVLVTGGGGHIGSQIVDAALAEGASRVLVYDNFAEGNSHNSKMQRGATARDLPTISILIPAGASYSRQLRGRTAL
jgi:NAD(P)-dependent dehydrogenase (short-subunit alcohol dehydrogenase family)